MAASGLAAIHRIFLASCRIFPCNIQDLVAPWHVGSLFPDQGWKHTERQSADGWTAKEGPTPCFSNYSMSLFDLQTQAFLQFSFFFFFLFLFCLFLRCMLHVNYLNNLVLLCLFVFNHLYHLFFVLWMLLEFLNVVLKSGNLLVFCC